MAELSIIADKNLNYPQGAYFSPSEKFPEYRYSDIATEPNPIYRAVRRCFAQAGLDRDRYGKPGWNPLGTWIQPGQRVFVLCNFVYHRRFDETIESFAAKCTQGAVLRALLDYVLIAVGKSGSVSFGNAPVQSCSWSSVLRDTNAQALPEFYQSVGEPVQAQDLRLYVAERTLAGSVKRLERRDEDEAVYIDLSHQSKLAQIPNVKTAHFRLSDYDPRRTEGFHSQGSHVYVLNKQVLDADAIVSLPKLKTHEKVGITCALKGCVGAIAHKDCLAHHRFGSPDIGGDEYPSDKFYFKRAISGFHDWVQQIPPEHVTGNLLRVSDRILRSGLRRLVPVTAGAWWGNDTAWRMALDIARILRYATANGEMQNLPVRPHLVLVDGIVGGEGTGPLKPTPVHSGLLLFADDPVVADHACALLMGFEPAKIPLIREAFALENYPLTEQSFGQGCLIYNGQEYPVSALANLVQKHYQPSPGWQGYIERSTALNSSPD
jgi:hypothetical protein